MASPFLGGSNTAYQLYIRRHLRFLLVLLTLVFLAWTYLFGSSSSTYSIRNPISRTGKDYDSMRAVGFDEDDDELSEWRVPGGRRSSVAAAEGRLEERTLRPEDRFTCDRCLSEPERCKIYGSRNVDLSRAFTGTGGRIQRVLERAEAGHAIKTAVLGGSISVGQGCKCTPWHRQVFNWLNETFPHPDNGHSDGSVGARGSDYFKFCHHEHIDTDSDLVFLEMSVNDFRMGDPAFENFETLLRSVLSYPSKPAVIILQTFKLDGIIATGGDSQLSLAEYYDVPVISARTWMLPMLMRDPDLLPKFFNYYMYEHGTDKVIARRDLLHPNADGHKSMSDTIILYLAQQICFLKNQLPYTPPADLPHIPQDNFDMDVLPRMRLNRHFTLDTTEPELYPTCASLDTTSSPLTPVASLTHGWELWTMPGFGGKKKFWRGQKPGDEIVFEVEIRSGQVTLYSLKSARYDLGSISCWLDDEKAGAVRLNGYWAAGVSVGERVDLPPISPAAPRMLTSPRSLPVFVFFSRTSRRFKTIFDNPTPPITPGRHLLHCAILEETNNPDKDAHDYLLIGLFSV